MSLIAAEDAAVVVGGLPAAVPAVAEGSGFCQLLLGAAG